MNTREHNSRAGKITQCIFNDGIRQLCLIENTRTPSTGSATLSSNLRNNNEEINGWIKHCCRKNPMEIRSGRESMIKSWQKCQFAALWCRWYSVINTKGGVISGEMQLSSCTFVYRVMKIMGSDLLRESDTIDICIYIVNISHYCRGFFTYRSLLSLLWVSRTEEYSVRQTNEYYMSNISKNSACTIIL